MKTEKPKIRHVEEMPVYQSFMDLAVKLETATRGIRADFKWLRIQALRSSESVCANLTEGFYSQYSTEYLQALYRCRREGRETTTHLDYAAHVFAIEPSEASELSRLYGDALNQLGGLIVAIERKISERGKARPLSYSVREEDSNYRYPLPNDKVVEPELPHSSSSISHPPFPISHPPTPIPHFPSPNPHFPFPIPQPRGES